MRQSSVLLLLLTAGFIGGFIGYCYALIDWVQDVLSGVYADHHVEAMLETTALGLYTYLAFRFLRSSRIRF